MSVRVLTSVFLAVFLMFPALSESSYGNSFDWSISGGLLFLPTGNGKQGADPFPILPSLGASFGWQFRPYLKLELTEDLYFKNYEYNAALGYPMPCNPENRSAFVMGFVTGIQVTGIIPIGDNGINVRVYGGPVADLRIVTLAAGLHPNDLTGGIETNARLQTNAIRKYFWSEGRWFFHVIGGGMDFPLNEKFLLGFDLRVWAPFYRLWTNDSNPGIDGWRFGIGVRVTPVRRSSIDL